MTREEGVARSTETVALGCPRGTQLLRLVFVDSNPASRTVWEGIGTQRVRCGLSTVLPLPAYLIPSSRSGLS